MGYNLEMKNTGKLKMLLFFVSGAIGPLLPKLIPGMGWNEVSTPFYIIPMIYTGTLVLIAYLMQSPISLTDLPHIDILNQAIEASKKDTTQEPS